jgi:hypothetical protein
MLSHLRSAQPEKRISISGDSRDFYFPRRIQADPAATEIPV